GSRWRRRARRTRRRVALDLSAFEKMSAEQIQVLQSPSPDPGPRSAAISGATSEAAPRIPEELSILPVREFVVFPGTILPLTVTRAPSIKLLDETLSITKVIGLLTQR